MRITIWLDDELLSDAKTLALETNKTLSDVVADGLHLLLARRAKEGERKPVELPRISGSGLQPGVDLDSNAELLDLMESDEFDT